ncbi:MAG: hypothetical protein QOD07_1433 [Frankiaceae bacterium]|jgi:hypothetical protein|nr:hypothetical protein [Frankiaceae bacterium]
MSALTRSLTVVVLTVVLVGGFAPAASAHSVNSGPQPSNYRSVLTSVTPVTDGIRIQLLDNGLHVQVTVTARHVVTVLGYSGEPYLQVDGSGAAVNTNAPDYYLNRNANLGSVPSSLASNAAPHWHTLGSAPQVIWHDHRTHFMGYTPPPAVAAAPDHAHPVANWALHLVVDGHPVIANGTLTWIPGPSPALPLTAAILGAAAITAGIAATRRRWWLALTMVATTSWAVELTRAAALVGGRSGPVTTRLGALAGHGALLLALTVTFGVLIRGALRRRLWAAGLAAFFGVITLLSLDLPGLSVLWRSQMLTSVSPPAFRALTATALASSLAVSIGGALQLRRLEPLPSRQPTTARVEEPV